MKIFITGASSYVGARLYLDLRKEFDTTGTYNNSKLSEEFVHLDTTNQKQVSKVVEQTKPNYIIHTAANASSAWCEENPVAAIALNERATQYIVEAANKNKCKIIFISSFAAFEPNNVYAKTKLKSEEIVKGTNAGWIILKPSLILGYSPNTTNDRPFNRLLRNLEDRTPAEYDISWKFQPTYIRQLSEIIIEVITRNIQGETIPVAVENLKSRFDTAKDILKPFGIEVKPIDKKDTKHFSVKKELSKLKELSLPFYTYEEMITEVIKEIKNKDKFTF